MCQVLLYRIIYTFDNKLFVTLHVSVWVEIFQSLKIFLVTLSHAPRERVSWNMNSYLSLAYDNSHAPRERVSWNSYWNRC